MTRSAPLMTQQGSKSLSLPACRPFGTVCLLAVYDHDGPQLYMIEPSGIAHVRPCSSASDARACTPAVAS